MANRPRGALLVCAHARLGLVRPFEFDKNKSEIAYATTVESKHKNSKNPGEMYTHSWLGLVCERLLASIENKDINRIIRATIVENN